MLKRTLLSLILFTLSSASMAMTDFTNAKITAVGTYIDGANLKFTLDKSGSNVWTTDNYSGDQLKTLVSLVLMAYASGKTIAFIRTFDDPAASTYIKVAQFEVGGIVH
jgi:hypothetical protein